MYAVNVGGTTDLLRLARELEVKRVVYTSSVATMGFKTDGTIVDEETPVTLKDMIGHYKRSKFLAEQEAIRRAADHHPEPDDADRSRRRQADADGSHPRRFPESQIPRVRGHRPQPGGRC